jgi:hypothetical protein
MDEPAWPGEAERLIRIPALLVALNHIGVGEKILTGMPRLDAYHQAHKMYYGHLVPAAAIAWWPGGGGVWQIQLAAYPKNQGPAHFTRCFAAAAAEARFYLLRSDEPGATGIPSLGIPAAEADQLAWQLEAMRRYATGGGHLDLCACARGAIDEAASKPRQRRAPVDKTWLAGEITGALDDLWGRLRHAASEAGGPYAEHLWPMPRKTAVTIWTLLRRGEVV